MFHWSYFFSSFLKKKSNLNVTVLLALVNLVTASLVAWVAGAGGGNAKSKGGEQFHFRIFCPSKKPTRLLNPFTVGRFSSVWPHLTYF